MAYSLLTLLILLFSSVSPSDLEVYRANYSKAATNKSVCERMIASLEKCKDSTPIAMGYLGGYQTVYANHVSNPFSKLSTFRQGKQHIEAAIAHEPNNIELRFIRLSVQIHAPFFLGYHSNVHEDTDFIQRHKAEIDSDILRKNVENLLSGK